MAEQHHYLDWQGIKQFFEVILLKSGTEADQISRHLEQDINDLAEISNCTQEVLGQILEEDYYYSSGMVWDFLSHMTDKMELFLLALQYQRQFSMPVAVGQVVEANTVLICQGCDTLRTFECKTTLEPCSNCACEQFDKIGTPTG